VTNTQTEKRELRERSLQREFERPELEHVSDGDSGLELAHAAVDAALDKKGLEPVLLDVRGLCSYANYILIVSGRSDRQVDAIAEGVREKLKPVSSMLGNEGIGSGQWALMDYGDLIIHVFHHPVRERYDLEGLWIDAPSVPVEIPEEARLTTEDRYGA
jgi:ribosome-associated protein